MTESLKTAVYVGVAIVLSLVALISRPRQEAATPPGLVGQALFEELKDPDAAASLEIVKYNESLGELHTFKVAKDGQGRWSIPSHENYPADAEDQMKKSATALIDLKVLDIASELRGDHSIYGVVEPKKDQLKAGDEGVGLLVAIQDGKGKDLASVIIGKKVKGADDKRFVRRRNQDLVYVVKLDPEQFKVKFEDWIEKDLLKLNSWAIRKVRINDYSVVKTLEGFNVREALFPRFDLTAAWDNTNSEWKLDDFVTYNEGASSKAELGANEKLDKEKLNALKNAVDELKIADVHRKPAGLTADLKAGEEFLKNNESLQSLFSRGFIPSRSKAGQLDIRAANGEVHVVTEDAVEYVLRFGNVAGTDSDESKLNRFLFVSTRVDKSLIPTPTLEDLPKEPGKSEPADDVDAFRKLQKEGIDKKEDLESQQAEYEKERQRITKENKRKQDEYDDKVKKAEEKVRELNGRFAEWYYVIAEPEYKKIHLGRDDLIAKEEKKDDKKEELKDGK